jgi:anti-sigma regulatory factor (Ser/Thr protein kinase)
MKELALHILDIAQNSINAGATHIGITISEDLLNDVLAIEVEDNGRGIPESDLTLVNDPFYSGGNKKTGLGIPLLKQQSELANGTFTISSMPGKGTVLRAVFQHSHIDRQPIGDITATVTALIRACPDIEWIFKYTFNKKTFTLDTREVRKEIESIPINNSSVIKFLKEMIDENLEALADESMGRDGE